MSDVQRVAAQHDALTAVNPLLTAALPLLLLINYIPAVQDLPEPLALRNHVIRQIALFETQAKAAGCSPKAILAARYCICTAIDEFVLCTAWGAHSSWAQQSLLSLIQKETWGGERFFIILDKLEEDAQHYRDVLELLYHILSLGFEGKYYNQERMVLEEIRYRLFQVIQHHQPFAEKLIATSNTIQATRYPHNWLNLWRMTWIFFTGLLGLWVMFNVNTYSFSRQVISDYESIMTSIANGDLN